MRSKGLPLCLAAIVAGTLLLSDSHAAPDRYRGGRGRDRHEIEIHRPGHLLHQLPPGYRAVEIHGARYFERGGVYFRSAPQGYIMVEPPAGVTIIATPAVGSVTATLPLGAVTLTIGGNVYYRHGNVFYRPQRNQYVVVERPPSVVVVGSQPVVPQVITSAPAPTAPLEYVSVWVGDREYFLRQGIFYKKTPEGLKRVDAPLGAVFTAPPAGSLDLWIGDTEYFYYASTFYQKRPEGYQIVPPPTNAYIRALPSSAKTVWSAGRKFSYLGGNFYEQKDEGYLITAPPVVFTPPALPVGTVMAAPPDGSVDFWVDDTEYFYFAGNFFRKQPTGYVAVNNPL